MLCPICVSDLLIGEDFDAIQATEPGGRSTTAVACQTAK